MQRPARGRRLPVPRPKSPKVGSRLPNDRRFPAFEFSTLDLPAREQFGAWRDNIGYFFDLMGPDDLKAGFACQQVAWDLGNLAFADIRHDTTTMTRIARHIRRDLVDHWLLSLRLQGSFKTVTPSGTFDGDAGRVQVHPLGKPFEGASPPRTC